MNRRYVALLTLLAIAVGATAFGQRTSRKPLRALPPKFQPNEFSGVFFPDAIAQLQGTPPTDKLASGPKSSGNSAEAEGDENAGMAESGNQIWKSLISDATIEDLVKEAKTRLDSVVTTPAKFAGGGFEDARREFTLIGTLLAVNSQYPDEIRWKSSAPYGRMLFSRTAANCKAGSQQVYNEAKLRLLDLANLLKGDKLSGTIEEVSWADTADRGPTMKLLDWAVRDNLVPATSSNSSFKANKEDVLKYAELVSMYGHIMQQPGMNDAEDATYVQLAGAMVLSAKEASKAARNGDAELARSAVGRIDQSCNKCHETYR